MNPVLQQISDCVCKELARIAASAESSVANEDVPQAIIDRINALGSIDPQLAQLASGAPWTHIITALVGEIARFLGGAAGEVESGLGKLFVNVLEPIGREVLGLLNTFGKDFVNALGVQAGQFSGFLDGLFRTVFTAIAGAETELPKLIFDEILKVALPAGGVTADNVEEVALKLFGSAFLVGQGVHLVAGVASYLGYPMSSVWANNAALMVDMLAYDEILKSFHPAFFREAVSERARQRFAKQFRAHIPRDADAFGGFARGKIGTADRDSLAALNGVDPAWSNLRQAVAYRPISPFMLARGFRNHAPPQELINAVITDQGITPQFHELMEEIIIDASYQNLYNTYATKSFAACDAGAITLDDLDKALQSANWDDKARSLARQIALLGRSQAVAAETERAALAELAAGVISPDAARSLMAAAGIDSWKIDTTVTLAAAKAAAIEHKKILTEERTQAKRILAEAVRATGQQYLAGSINGIALTAALDAEYAIYFDQIAQLGANPEELIGEEAYARAEIAATVVQLNAQAMGKPTFVYGRIRSREAGALLSAQVQSIKEAVIRGDLDPAAAQQNLQSLDISNDLAQALVNRWISQLSTKGSQPLGPNQPQY